MTEVLDLEVRVPVGLDYIPLNHYQKYMKVVEGIDAESEEASSFLNLKALEIFCGLELRDSYKLPMSAFNAVLEQLAKCLSEPTPLVKRFTIKGTDGASIEFGFNPNLREMTFGEYVDLDRYISSWADAHKAMAILYRPVIGAKKDMYRIEDYEGSDKYSDLLRYMPTSIALGAMVFFYRLGMKLSKHMMDYSLQLLEKEELSEEQKRLLQRDMDGIKASMPLLEEMHSDFQMPPVYRYTKR